MRFSTCLVFFFVCSRISFCQESKDSAALSKNLDQVVITAQFAPTDSRETVNSVRVLNRKIIEQRSVVNLQELLQTEPNMRIAQDAILGSELSINGLKGENLKILIDGVPVVGRLNGNIDAGQIPLSSVQKIEIIEGAQALLYGSEASGGVINLITKKSQASALESEISSQFESNGFRNLTARAGYTSGKFTAQASGNILEFVPLPDSTGSRDQLWNPKRQKSGRAMLRYKPSESTDIRLSGNILSEVVDNLGEKRRVVFKPYAFDDFYYTDRYDFSLFAERWTKSHKLIQTTLGWNTFRRIKNSFRYDFDENINELLIGLQDTSSASGYLGRVTYASDSKSKSLNYLFGVENYYETASGNRLYDSTATNPGSAYTNDMGWFGSFKYKPTSAITLQSGARWTLNMRYGSALTPSTWLLWQPKLPFQARLSWAYGFRSPSVKELFFSFVDINHYVIGNPNLKPERSVNLRGEIKWKSIHINDTELSITTTGFYNKVNQRIILTALGPVHYEYRNVESWKTSGASIRLNANFGSYIRFQSDLITTGFNNAEKQNSNPSSSYLWSTDWANDLTVSVFDGKLSCNIWHKMTGKTPYFFNQDGKTLEAYTDRWQMLNAGLSTHFLNKKLRINTGVKNIFDIRQLQANINNGIHIEASNQQNLHWGRNFYVGMIWLWQGKMKAQ
ncbi:MAG: TonB-dependent receptor [Saprospiraceae bacterium]|nr:TonB-dependent receptor [Saprospiraceae bacterium]